MNWSQLGRPHSGPSLIPRVRGGAMRLGCGTRDVGIKLGQQRKLTRDVGGSRHLDIRVEEMHEKKGMLHDVI